MPFLSDFWSWIAQHSIAVSVAAWVLFSFWLVGRRISVQRRRTSEALAKYRRPLPPEMPLEIVGRPEERARYALGGDPDDEQVQGAISARVPPSTAAGRPAEQNLYQIGRGPRSEKQRRIDEALEIEAGQLAYQVPKRMWRDTPENSRSPPGS